MQVFTRPHLLISIVFEYNKTPKQMAKMIIDRVMSETGICASAGVGTNLYLAKIAMDIFAKHADSHIALLSEQTYQKYLWHHTPITDFWNVGSGTARRLERLGVTDMYGVTQLPERVLYKEFGVDAEFLIDHAWGRESCTIADIHNYKGEPKSLSNSQILFEDYDCEDAHIIMDEMLDNLVMELVDNNLYAGGIHLYIGYSKDVIPSTGGSHKLSEVTCSFRRLREEFDRFYWKKVRVGYPIRQIGISLERLTYEPCINLSFFDSPEKDEKEQNITRALIEVKQRFGKNAVLRGTSFLEKATGRERNVMVGGHRA